MKLGNKIILIISILLLSSCSAKRYTISLNGVTKNIELNLRLKHDRIKIVGDINCKGTVNSEDGINHIENYCLIDPFPLIDSNSYLQLEKIRELRLIIRESELMTGDLIFITSTGDSLIWTPDLN